MIRWLREIFFFVLFVLFQTLVIKNIHLFGIITPYIYIFVILKFRIDISRSGLIFLSFLLGLIIDIFSNTYGIHTAACSFIGFIRTPLLERFVDMRELPDGSVPSYRLFGFVKFFRYVLILVTLHHVILFAIDSFGFFQPLLLIIRMLSSIALTTLLLLIIESFYLGKIKHGE
jgi:rod shape-determining protein MreD